MVTARKTEAGFTLTEMMVVVVILIILSAIATPVLTRDSTARKGRGWASTVAQTLQKARFQAMGDRANIHVMLYRTHMAIYREEPAVPPAGPTFTLLTRTPGPAPDGDKTIAIWAARTDNTVPTAQHAALTGTASAPAAGSLQSNEIVFTPLGSTLANANWRIYLRNELLASLHPDASFLVRVGGLTGFVTANDKVVLP